MKQLLLNLLGQRPPRPAPPGPAAKPNAAPPWQHPQATHHTLLQQRHLAYRLQRSRRRSIGLRITAQGLDVRAPGWTLLPEIEAVLQRKSAWLLQKLHEAEARSQHAEHQRIDWHDGCALPYLGAPLTLRISAPHSPAPRGGQLDDSAPDGPVLWLALPPEAHPPDAAPDTRARLLEAAAHRWLDAQARRVFTARLDHFAPQVGVRWQRLSVSRARTRWGSASGDGSIRLNRQLIHLPLPLIDYVAVHELAHLHEMNHSPRFWAHVERVLPDWAERRRALRQISLAGLD